MLRFCYRFCRCCWSDSCHVTWKRRPPPIQIAYVGIGAWQLPAPISPFIRSQPHQRAFSTPLPSVTYSDHLVIMLYCSTHATFCYASSSTHYLSVGRPLHARKVPVFRVIILSLPLLLLLLFRVPSIFRAATFSRQHLEIFLLRLIQLRPSLSCSIFLTWQSGPHVSQYYFAIHNSPSAVYMTLYLIG